jgi:class 3 adenylate cyclase
VLGCILQSVGDLYGTTVNGGSFPCGGDGCGTVFELVPSVGGGWTERAARGNVTCQIGVGIHTGEVLHGFIGSAEQMEFTVIGAAVNRATRYCDAAKVAEVLVSPEVHQWVWNLVEGEQIAIPTNHEGEFPAYRINRLRSTR